VQDPAFAFVEPHQVPLCPTFQPVQVTLNVMKVQSTSPSNFAFVSEAKFTCHKAFLHQCNCSSTPASIPCRIPDYIVCRRTIISGSLWTSCQWEDVPGAEGHPQQRRGWWPSKTTYIPTGRDLEDELFWLPAVIAVANLQAHFRNWIWPTWDSKLKAQDKTACFRSRKVWHFCFLSSFLFFLYCTWFVVCLWEAFSSSASSSGRLSERTVRKTAEGREISVVLGDQYWFTWHVP